MTNPWLTLRGVSYTLPNGRSLFSGLNITFDHRPTGLIGRNGVGKSILGKLLAGRLQPGTGQRLASGPVHWLAQQVVPPDGLTIADLAGVGPALEALGRIEAGSCAAADFATVGDRWDLRQRLHDELQRNRLGHLSASTPAHMLSGGEAMRVALLGAWLSGADFLILDEPSNHLDAAARLALLRQLRQWPRGLLVISHDRPLLDTMQRTVELSPLGLTSCSGDYRTHVELRSRQRQGALDRLQHLRLERRRHNQAAQEQRERQARRQARGASSGKNANQAAILLGGRKNRSETSTGKLALRHAAGQAELDTRVHEAAQTVARDAPVCPRQLPDSAITGQRVVELDGVILPFVTAATRHLELLLRGRQRVAITGANGCGKSTLMKVLAGHLAPLAGNCKRHTSCVHLDQRLAPLDPDRSALQQLHAANPAAAPKDLRARLAQLGLDAQAVVTPSGRLSGGERLKLALACALYAAEPPPLLLLDEPTNHLDLPSLEALEILLRSYRGTLVVVSHDAAFLEAIEPTDLLRATPASWRLDPWPGPDVGPA